MPALHQRKCGSLVTHIVIAATSTSSPDASIDKDGSGSIDRTEIAALAVEMGRPMKEWELDEAMRVMDTDGSGEVTHSTTSSLTTAVTT
eukprot:COSAG01_NODE_7424_length_3214_cov_2.336116_2_plen_89_part_00